MSNVPGGHCWHIEYTNGHEVYCGLVLFEFRDLCFCISGAASPADLVLTATDAVQEDLNLNELLEILVHYEDTGCKRKARHQDSELKHGEDSDAVGHEENKPFDRNGASSSYADEHRNSPCSGQSSVSGTLLVNVGEPAVQSRHEIYSLWM